MIERFLPIAALIWFLPSTGIAPAGTQARELAEMPKAVTSGVYEFTVKDIDGTDVELAKYKGRVCLVVNVASR